MVIRLRGARYLYPAMEATNQAIRLYYTRLSESIQAELTFLYELSNLTDDETFRQSIAEIVYSLNEVSDTLDQQRRHLRPGSAALEPEESGLRTNGERG